MVLKFSRIEPLGSQHLGKCWSSVTGTVKTKDIISTSYLGGNIWAYP